jgi:anti-sigma factor RsiW
MNCHSLRNVLDLRAEGRLSPRRARAVEAHLASCADCRALAAPPASPAPAAPAPRALKDRLRAAAATPVSLPPAPAPGGLALWPTEARGVALAAAALLLIGALAFAFGVPSQSAGPTAVAVEDL